MFCQLNNWYVVKQLHNPLNTLYFTVHPSQPRLHSCKKKKKKIKYSTTLTIWSVRFNLLTLVMH